MEELKAGRMVVATAAARDVNGNPTALPGPISWSTNDQAVLEITTNADGTCTVKGVAMGQAKLHARSGEVMGEVNVQVVADAAAYLEITLVPFPETGGRAR